MSDSALPTERPKSRTWWVYLLFVLAAIGVLLAAAFFTGVLGLSIFLARLSDRGLVGTPEIYGQVVDIITQEPVAGMNVCLLETFKNSGPTDGAGPWTDIRRGEVTQTDVAGVFAFPEWKAKLDFFQSEDKYSISITEPVGDLMCGLEFTGQAGHGRTFQNPPSASHRQRHYFPMAIVNDPDRPPPVSRSTGFTFGNLPAAVYFRKIGDPAHLRIELIPLLENDSECAGALDPAPIEMCKRANNSDAAMKWRDALKDHS